eukprot:sb/3468523/
MYTLCRLATSQLRKLSEVSPRAMSYAVTRDHRRDSDLEEASSRGPRPLSLGFEGRGGSRSDMMRDQYEWNWDNELREEEEEEGGVFMLLLYLSTTSSSTARSLPRSTLSSQSFQSRYRPPRKDIPEEGMACSVGPSMGLSWLNQDHDLFSKRGYSVASSVTACAGSDRTLSSGCRSIRFDSIASQSINRLDSAGSSTINSSDLSIPRTNSDYQSQITDLELIYSMSDTEPDHSTTVTSVASGPYHNIPWSLEDYGRE